MKKEFSKGSALFLVILITCLLMALALGLNLVSISQKKTLKEMENSIKALFAADTGVEYILYLNSKCYQESCPSYCLSNCEGLPLGFATSGEIGEAKYLAKMPFCQKFQSKGEFKGVKRAIEAKGYSYKIVFAKKVSGGNLGGISGADNICQNAANSTNLPGDYKAWITDTSSTTEPAQRFTTSSLPYILPNCIVVARSWKDLTDGHLTAPINVDETGTKISDGSYVFTNTNSDGTQTGNGIQDTCNDWNMSGGKCNVGIISSSITDHRWTSATSGSFCHLSAYIYCFQQ